VLVAIKDELDCTAQVTRNGTAGCHTPAQTDAERVRRSGRHERGCVSRSVAAAGYQESRTPLPIRLGSPTRSVHVPRACSV
jgi:hypothetical protein